MLNGAVRFVRALPVLPVVLLVGCGVAGTQFHPGVAAQVGDETITSRHVDEVTDNYCTALEKVTKGQPQANVEPTPLSHFSAQFATALVEKAAAEQLADDHDVEPTSSYRSDLAQLEPQIADLDDDEQDAVREVIGAQAYTDDVLTQIGAQSLEEQGGAEATVADQLAEGRSLLDAWIKDHDVEVNPKYAVAVGGAEPVDTDLSFALGDTAKGGALGPADPQNPDADEDELRAAYVAGLPADLVCLD